MLANRLAFPEEIGWVIDPYQTPGPVIALHRDREALGQETVARCTSGNSIIARGASSRVRKAYTAMSSKNRMAPFNAYST